MLFEKYYKDANHYFRFEGHGTYCGNALKFKGSYVPHGTGKVKFNNGDFFSGHFKFGFVSYGRYTWANGCYAFVRHTHSITFYTRTTSYSNAGFPDPKNPKTINYSNGTYVGEVKNGKRDGIGKYSWTNGDFYEGGWKDGERHGIGKYTWADGSYELNVYDDGDKKCTIRSYSPQNEQESYSSYSTNSNSYDNDDDYSYDSDSSESYYDSDSTSGSDSYYDDMYERGLDAYNNGDYSTADYYFRTIENSDYSDDYVTEDGDTIRDLREACWEGENSDDEDSCEDE